jgi:hypothetical protein
MDMKIRQKYKILILIFFGTIITAVVLWILGYNPKIVIGLGILIFFMFFAMWDTPPKHKDFSDRDRLQATSRALGGSPPPELWTPDMPAKDKKRQKKKRL